MRVNSIKPPVEIRYKKELEALKATDTGKVPVNWQMSPMAVKKFILLLPETEVLCL